MTLKSCLEIGIECGLKTISEAMLNIEIHALSIFSYSDLNKELEQLYKEKEELLQKTDFSNNDESKSVLEWINNNDVDRKAVEEARKRG